VNSLIADLVQPTTEVARVIGAVAKGDLSRTMALDVEGRPLKGEFLRTAKVVNAMVGQLSRFASEVTCVAREVGIEGKLGGQADSGRRSAARCRPSRVILYSLIAEIICMFRAPCSYAVWSDAAHSTKRKGPYASPSL
jgi:HAMP domain-containing protein